MYLSQTVTICLLPSSCMVLYMYVRYVNGNLKALTLSLKKYNSHQSCFYVVSVFTPYIFIARLSESRTLLKNKIISAYYALISIKITKHSFIIITVRTFDLTVKGQHLILLLRVRFFFVYKGLGEKYSEMFIGLV